MTEGVSKHIRTFLTRSSKDGPDLKSVIRPDPAKLLLIQKPTGSFFSYIIPTTHRTLL